MTNQRILIGCDPELFLRNPNSGTYFSAHDMIPGTKEEPHKVPNGMVQVDGTALEFGIDPAATEDEFVNRINSVKGTLREMVDPGYEIVAHPVATFEPAYFKQLPPWAVELGCTPDYNAWTGDVNPQPNQRSTFRTGSGHIHIGWTDKADLYDQDHIEQCRAVARQMDYYLGIYSVLWDNDTKRRELYGKAGAYRIKPYGVEYRTLSNRWTDSEILMRWVYRAALKGTTDLLFNGKDATNDYGNVAVDIINHSDETWQKWADINVGLMNPPVGLRKAA